MLPILVLLVATSALAAPGISNVRQISQNDIRSSDNSLLGSALSIIDGGDINFNTLSIEAILKDLSKLPNSQGQANGQAVALLGELSTGRPGDACAAANLVNAYARYVATGNAAGVREALRGYIQSVASNIDNLARLVSNPESVRYATGSRGGCAGEGRAYQFEAAWETILGSASPNQISLVNEEYCTAKRLYCAFNARSNNAGAQITASALPPSVQVYNAASGAISNLLRALASNSNVGQSAASAKQALINAVNRVNL